MSAFWINAPRDGFTAFAAQTLNAPVPVDDVTDREVQVIQQRHEWLQVVTGAKRATPNHAIRSAVVVSRN